MENANNNKKPCALCHIGYWEKLEQIPSFIENQILMVTGNFIHSKDNIYSIHAIL